MGLVGENRVAFLPGSQKDQKAPPSGRRCFVQFTRGDWFSSTLTTARIGISWRKVSRVSCNETFSPPLAISLYPSAATCASLRREMKIVLPIGFCPSCSFVRRDDLTSFAVVISLSSSPRSDFVSRACDSCGCGESGPAGLCAFLAVKEAHATRCRGRFLGDSSTGDRGGRSKFAVIK